MTVWKLKCKDDAGGAYSPDLTVGELRAGIKHVYEKIITSVDPSSVTVVGDSAGGNLALILPFLVKANRQPGSIIALSPVVDLSADNPSMDTIEPIDPLLPLDAIRLLFPRYYTGTIAKDPLISPLFADYTKIASRLYILNSGKDLLSPDIELFHKLLEKKGVRHTYVFEQHLPHAWPILPIRSASVIRMQIAEWCSKEG